jgi:hypothetical protein
MAGPPPGCHSGGGHDLVPVNQKPDRTDILAAARADGIPAGTCRLWTVKKFRLAKPLPAGSYTQLWRATLAALHLAEHGELVMQDTPEELNTHLEFMLKARGRVLITGLGLGCVARGCLANPQVESVTIIERDPAVMRLVSPWMPAERVTIIVADALAWATQSTERFDCAWHDLWSDPDKDEPHLQITHLALICALSDRTDFQGAWQFPRQFRGRTGNVI